MRLIPIHISVNLNLYEEYLDALIHERDELLKHIDHINNSLIMSSFSVLLLSFLVDIRNSKVWKAIYVLCAVALAIFALYWPPPESLMLLFA